MTIADDVDASGVNLDASNGEALSFEAGDNVSFGQIDGLNNCANMVLSGDSFTTGKAWKLGMDDDALVVGDGGTFNDIDMKEGDDTLRFGNFATVN